MPPIILNLYDKSSTLGITKNTYLGRALIDITQHKEKFKGFEHAFNKTMLASEADQIPEPSWFDIKYGNEQDEPTTGAVLASFMIAPSDQLFATPIERVNLYQRISQLDFNISMNIFGLRNLQSFGLLPIRKPFIKFNIKSLVPPEHAQAVTNLKTQTGKGADPNYNCILNFNVKLPENVVFSPVLKCEVFDCIFLSFNQPLIGHFGIMLGEIRQRQIQKA